MRGMGHAQPRAAQAGVDVGVTADEPEAQHVARRRAVFAQFAQQRVRVGPPSAARNLGVVSSNRVHRRAIIDGGRKEADHIAARDCFQADVIAQEQAARYAWGNE